MVILLIIVVLLFFLYLFLIDGRRNANGMDKLIGYCYAHRGLHSVPDAPENSLAAFKRAAGEGYGAELCKSVCKVLDAYNGDYCIESFDPRCVMWFRKHRPDIIRDQLSQNFIKNPSGQIRIIDFIITSLITNVFTRPDFIAYNFKNRKDLSNFLCTKLLKIKGFS